MLLRLALEKRYPHSSERAVAFREKLIRECQWYIDAGLGDVNSLQRLCSDDDLQYWQAISEVAIALKLRETEILFGHRNDGPDFCIDYSAGRIWIEVICPTVGNNMPEDWCDPRPMGCVAFPHEEILLRWVAAIKEKTEKLIGNIEKNQIGYIDKGIVRASDIYVIAVNGRLLRSQSSTAISELIGISKSPFAAEAMLGIGLMAAQIDRDTGEIYQPRPQYRSSVKKSNGAYVPTNNFWDPRFAPVSAIWAIDIDEKVFLEGSLESLIIHNPNALNPLPRGILPAYAEYIATGNADSFSFEKFKGSIVPQANICNPS